MKFLVLLFIVAVIAWALYVFVSNVQNRNVARKRRKERAILVTAIAALTLLSMVALGMYSAATAPDTQCTTVHTTASFPPATRTTSMDYFEQGNYDYDIGNCAKAIADYAQSIKLNPLYPQAYNNRAYTFMRMHNYRVAMTDLDTALSLDPNYIQALMNRGDIRNYYLADRAGAIADYQKVIALGGTQGTSVCGHLFLAEHNGWNIGTLIGLPGEIGTCQ